jgi:hypothetical protein
MKSDRRQASAEAAAYLYQLAVAQDLMFSYEGKHYPPANGTKPAPRREHARSIGSPRRVANEATRAENKRSGCGGQSTRLPLSLAARATPVRYSISFSNIPALALVAFIGQSTHHAFFDDMDEFWLRNKTDRPIRKDEAHLPACTKASA